MTKFGAGQNTTSLASYKLTGCFVHRIMAGSQIRVQKEAGTLLNSALCNQ